LDKQSFARSAVKISSSQQQLAASHTEFEHREVSERLRIWTGERPEESSPRGPNDRPLESTSVALSLAAQALASASIQTPPTLAPGVPPPLRETTASGEASAVNAALEHADNDPMLALLRDMLERMFGIRLDVFDASEMQTKPAAGADRQEAPSVEATDNNRRFGLEYEYHARRTETETTRFAVAGSVLTADGAEIRFALSFEMSRSYSEEIDLSVRLGSAARKKDPLVLNFSGPAAQLSDRRFAIDLDGDGQAEQAHFLGQGSGFLVFDRDGNGRVDGAGELFGPASGDGFAELGAHDADHNGWIDENDAVFARLRVWTKTDAGEDVLRSLAEAKVGAISLARLATPFELKDADNALRGEVRSTSVYFGDDGRVGTVQQIDLAV
jgi:hypothetical protein